MPIFGDLKLRKTRARRLRRRRGGFAIILVLGMIAMTLAVSYALVRGQAATARGSSNHELRSEARQAALTGLSAALRRMNQSNNWGGADSTFTGTVNSGQTFAVQYITGDAKIDADGPDAAKWPYRTTITSTGYAVDPAASAVTTTYRVEAVVELVPRRLADNPSAWATMQNYQLYQTNTDDNSLQLPFRINGPARFLGSLNNFCSSYPPSSSGRTRYLSDLQAMRYAGYPDYRPFTGPITYSQSTTTGSTRNLITDNLGVTMTNASGSATSNWNHPGNITSYQLFPGGKSYAPATLTGTVAATLRADPRTNPAGLFVANGDVTLGNGASIVGTVIATGKVRFNGTNLSIQPFSLPALDGTTSAVQLPAVVAGNDILVGDESSAAVQGNVVTFAKFSVTSGDHATQWGLSGRLICRQFEVQSRSQFNIGSLWWSFVWSWFNDQLGTHDDIDHYPVYCAAWGMNYVPKITINPPTGAAVVAQWFTAGSPLYKVDTGDVGLRWSLIRMKEQP